jgi:hypothetical protein
MTQVHVRVHRTRSRKMTANDFCAKNGKAYVIHTIRADSIVDRRTATEYSRDLRAMRRDTRRGDEERRGKNVTLRDDAR